MSKEKGGFFKFLHINGIYERKGEIKRMKLGICLAGGGVKGAAHIGALKALEEENIKIDYIGGTSSGSIVAALYAAGFNPNEIYQIFKKYCKNIKYVDFKNIFKLIIGLIFTGKIKIDGLNSGDALEKLIKKECAKKSIFSIDDIRMPLAIPSVDMQTGKVMCFTSCEKRAIFSDKTIFVNHAPIGKVVRASCSYPVVFSPCSYKNLKLLDGGIRENVPWKELKILGAERILNIIFQNENDINCCDNIIEVASRSMELLSRELSNYEMEGADMTIKIESKKIGLLDMSKIDELYGLGYQTVKEKIRNL